MEVEMQRGSRVHVAASVGLQRAEAASASLARKVRVAEACAAAEPWPRNDWRRRAHELRDRRELWRAAVAELRAKALRSQIPVIPAQAGTQDTYTGD